MLSNPRIATLAALSLGVMACSEPAGPPPQPVVTPIDSTTAASIRARVTFAGKVPEPIELNMRSARGCADLHPEPVFHQPVVTRDGALADVLVYIKNGLGERVFQFPTDPVVIDQVGCLYKPRVAALMTGQPLEFVNSDTEAHNVRGKPNVARSWNFMMSRQKTRRTVYFSKPEVGIQVGCDVHPWMSATVSVLAHPYFAITDAKGLAVLSNLPPGEYTVAAWHETLGEREQKITLAAKGAGEVSFAF